MLLIFFFKQETADVMRISDWSSDVCSSDLRRRCSRHQGQGAYLAEPGEPRARWRDAAGVGRHRPRRPRRRGAAGTDRARHRRVIVYRLCKAAHVALDGEGARLWGARWNSAGPPMVTHAASHLLPVVDWLVHLGYESDLLPADLRT